MFVIMKDTSQDLGEGYSSYSPNEFLGIANTVDEARDILSILVDWEIGEVNPYGFRAEVYEEDWNQICLDVFDLYDTGVVYHFEKYNYQP